MRGAYIAMVIADILNIITDELKDGVGDYIASLQTYEGGLAATPFEEAHGGYTFCGFAGLTILQEQHKIDLGKLLYWATNRQLSTEGGFNGRTNKVVDACYTFWVGALFPLLNIATGNALHNEGRQ
jgi:protein farnesyltransferase subunit beta